MTQIVFGAGAMWGINNVATPTPKRFGKEFLSPSPTTVFSFVSSAIYASSALLVMLGLPS